MGKIQWQKELDSGLEYAFRLGWEAAKHYADETPRGRGLPIYKSKLVGLRQELQTRLSGRPHPKRKANT